MLHRSRVKAFSGKLVDIGTRVNEGKLEFGPARENELDALKRLYDGVWGKGLEIAKDQLGAQIDRFREGQIVGRIDGVPVSMINIMLTSFGQISGIGNTYEITTGNQTFSTHVDPARLYELTRETESIPVALCVSIAVEKDRLRNGVAVETLNYARRMANESGLYVVPYSAPRSFAAHTCELEDMRLEKYLMITQASKLDHNQYAQRLFDYAKEHGIQRLDTTEARSALRLLLGEDIVPIEAEMFDKLRAEGVDRKARRFLEEREFCKKHLGVELTVEEFCLAYGRELVDVVLGMHLKNGARFVRDEKGLIVGYANSRDDPSAKGHNVLMTYDPHPYFNNDNF